MRVNSTATEARLLPLACREYSGVTQPPRRPAVRDVERDPWLDRDPALVPGANGARSRLHAIE